MRRLVKKRMWVEKEECVASRNIGDRKNLDCRNCAEKEEKRRERRGVGEGNRENWDGYDFQSEERGEEKGGKGERKGRREKQGGDKMVHGVRNGN